VSTADLLAEPLIVMRSGYVMHRYLHRLLQGQPPAFSYSTDGAEMGKLMVAEGLGLTVLPDFSVIGDPLEQHGVITWRPLADDDTGVNLVIQRSRSGSPPLAARDLHGIFVERARAYTAAHPATVACPATPAPRAAGDDPPASRPGGEAPGSRRRRGKTRVRS
jgi:DNA-binding transcriptional LysR family regulator